VRFAPYLAAITTSGMALALVPNYPNSSSSSFRSIRGVEAFLDQLREELVQVDRLFSLLDKLSGPCSNLIDNALRLP
jgi:hypothetical protein